MTSAPRFDHRVFVGVLFLLSYLWQAVIFATGGVDSRLFPLLMFFPAAVAILFVWLNKEPFKAIGWGMKRPALLPLAFLVPILVALTTILILTLAGWASWSNSVFAFQDGLVDVRRVRLILGKGMQSTGFFALNLLLTLLLQSIPGSVLTLGEEIGWRGYLQKKLSDRYGVVRGVLFLGLIWGYWHLPVVLMGYNFPSQPLLGALLLMPLAMVSIGLFFSWLYVCGGSVWLPTLAHTSLNLSAGLLYADMSARGDRVVIPLVFIAVWAVVGVICLRSLRKESPEPSPADG
jgi:membrane protease YdiL (CAAX protease family)